MITTEYSDYYFGTLYSIVEMLSISCIEVAPPFNGETVVINLN